MFLHVVSNLALKLTLICSEIISNSMICVLILYLEVTLHGSYSNSQQGIYYKFSAISSFFSYSSTLGCLCQIVMSNSLYFLFSSFTFSFSLSSSSSLFYFHPFCKLLNTFFMISLVLLLSSPLFVIVSSFVFSFNYSFFSAISNSVGTISYGIDGYLFTRYCAAPLKKLLDNSGSQWSSLFLLSSISLSSIFLILMILLILTFSSFVN